MSDCFTPPTERTVQHKQQRVVIVPGNGCEPIEESNWYCHLRDSLNALPMSDTDRSPAYVAVAQTMPDPDEAYERAWLIICCVYYQPPAPGLVCVELNPGPGTHIGHLDNLPRITELPNRANQAAKNDPGCLSYASS